MGMCYVMPKTILVRSIRMTCILYMYEFVRQEHVSKICYLKAQVWEIEVPFVRKENIAIARFADCPPNFKVTVGWGWSRSRSWSGHAAFPDTNFSF